MTKYHMVRQDKAITSESEIRKLLAAGRLASVAMCRKDEPYIITMNYGYDPDRHVLYFHCGFKGQKLEFIAANPAVCATVIYDLGYVDGKCEHKYQSLLIRGSMKIIDDFEEKKHGIEVLMEHQESDADPVRKRNFTTDADYNKFLILKLDIMGITGKQSL
ncbi:MAG: pyridoxamine 5'-phosphate oxidase family protein [Bacteroidales bacterium]|nr:pyridoxamine 5'-phosphate oxidase family protein [Candidatus Latescibacterota bacterium]